jgi:hypothetical protein
MEATMRKFGWVRNLFGPPTAQTWDADFPTPVNIIAGTSVTLAKDDERTLEQLRKDYPLPVDKSADKKD